MKSAAFFKSMTFAVVGLIAIAACGSSTTSNVKEGGTLLVALDADAQTMNPFEVGDVSSARATSGLFPGLYQADKNLNVVPDLADGMPTVSSDLKTWTVKLKTGAKWSDGTPITAKDVVTTVQIQASSKLDTDATFDWSPLTDPVTGVSAKDDHTVVFTLTAPFAPFLAINLATFVAPDAVYGKIDPAKMRSDPTNDHPTVTGGPWLYDKRVAGQEIDMTANPNWFGGKAHVAKVSYKIITNTTAAAQAVINGDVNWDLEVNGSAIDLVQQATGINTYVYPDLAYYDIRFNDRVQWTDKSRKSLFSDVNVRRAFAYALDKNSIVKTATDGHGTPMWGDIVPASAYYDDSAVVKYAQDVAKAKSLLDAAGWVVGSDGIRVKDGQRFSSKFYVRADKPQRVKGVQIIAEQLRAVGMDLQPTPTDFKVFYKPIQAGNYDLAFAGWGLALDPDDYTFFHSSQIRPEKTSSGSNWTGFVNSDLDAAIEAQRADLKSDSAATFAARKADFAKIEHILGDNVAVYFMWADNVGMSFNGVAGVQPGNNNSLNYADQGRNEQIFSQWSLATVK